MPLYLSGLTIKMRNAPFVAIPLCSMQSVLSSIIDVRDISSRVSRSQTVWEKALREKRVFMAYSHVYGVRIIRFFPLLYLSFSLKWKIRISHKIPQHSGKIKGFL